jgi:hypothetical protein
MHKAITIHAMAIKRKDVKTTAKTHIVTPDIFNL